MHNTLLDNLPISIVDGEEVMSSLDLAKLCYGDKHDKHSHKRFMDKALKVLGESTMANFCHPKTYGNNNIKKTLNLPQREACLMAMSYSYDLQAKVYDAWVNSTKAHLAVLESCSLEEAQSHSMSVLNQRLLHIKELDKEGKTIQYQVSKLLQDHLNDPENLLKCLKDIAKNLPTLQSKDREQFWKDNYHLVDRLRERYRTETKAKNYKSNVYDGYEQILHYITKRISQMRALKNNEVNTQ